MTERALVTGASTGIGRAIAKELAAAGFSVSLIGRDESGLLETKRVIDETGGHAECHVVDLRDGGAIKTMADSVNQQGALAAIVNCAGVWHNSDRPYYGARLWETAEDELDEVFEVGIRAPMLLARALLPAMVQRQKGKIVNISGTFSAGGAGWLHYYVSKKAIEDFTVGLADEVRSAGIQVNCVSPSDVKTPALRKFFSDDYDTALEADEVARFVSFLISPEADNITGSCTILRKKVVT